MKKYGVIIYKETDNFGDDIQTYAAYKLLPKVDYFIDREHLDDFHSENGEKVYCIFNGWYLYNNINWPPSKDIIPLLISMHFTYELVKYKTSLDLFIKRLQNYFNYFCDNGIGCRDSSTLELFKDNSSSYLSYCLTLTLSKYSIEQSKEDYICLVDVSDNIYNYINLHTEKKIIKYTHDYRNNTFENIPYEERMKNVEERLKVYQNASCVITSRYHVALPCLSLETPVVLIPSNYEPNRYKDLDGLVNMCDEDKFINESLFDVNNPTPNPKKYLEIRKKILKKVNYFINDYECNKKDYQENFLDLNLKKYLGTIETQENHIENLKRIIWEKNDEIYRLNNIINRNNK